MSRSETARHRRQRTEAVARAGLATQSRIDRPPISIEAARGHKSRKNGAPTEEDRMRKLIYSMGVSLDGFIAWA